MGNGSTLSTIIEYQLVKSSYKREQEVKDCES